MCNWPTAELAASRILDTRPIPDYTQLMIAAAALRKYIPSQGTADVEVENRRLHDGEK